MAERLLRALALALLALGLRAQAQDAGGFTPVYRVLTHPRCMNCHTSTGFPRQGDEGRRHEFGVVRGPAGQGVAGMQCSTCHTTANQPVVPGAPHWGLAPLAMAWEGKSEAEVCRQLKDRQRNGGRTLAMLKAHLAHDRLVGWGWAPGGTRTPVTPSRDEFVQAFQHWVDHGTRCPGDATPGAHAPARELATP